MIVLFLSNDFLCCDNKRKGDDLVASAFRFAMRSSEGIDYKGMIDSA